MSEMDEHERKMSKIINRLIGKGLEYMTIGEVLTLAYMAGITHAVQAMDRMEQKEEVSDE